MQMAGITDIGAEAAEESQNSSGNDADGEQYDYERFDLDGCSFGKQHPTTAVGGTAVALRKLYDEQDPDRADIAVMLGASSRVDPGLQERIRTAGPPLDLAVCRRIGRRDDERGGYFFTADDAETLIVRTKTVYDNAVPAGNGTMIGVLARLFYLTGEQSYLHRAEALIAAFSGELARNFFPLATYLNNTEFLQRAQQIVVVGDPEAPDTRAMLRVPLDRSLPDRLLTVVPPGNALPAGHPASGKGQLDGQVTAYLCRGLTCQAPMTDPDVLAAALDAA